MVKNDPNFKTLEIAKCTKMLKMSTITKLPQSDKIWKWAKVVQIDKN